MKLYYYQDDMANFGDDLNDWLWPKVLPDFFDNDANHLMLGIGSILNHKLPEAKKYTVLGSGWGYGNVPDINNNWDIKCVRGKISCQALGLPEELGIIDPAYLLQDYITEHVEKKYSVSLIPHAKSLELGHWTEVCELLGIHLIDPRTTDIDFFVNEVRASERVLTEAMHGAIIADCFGVPWCGYRAYSYINGVKWNDWLSALEEEVSLVEINSLYKGYEDLSNSEKVKNEIKLILRSLGLFQQHWSRPIERKSSSRKKLALTQQIRKIIEDANFSYSDRGIVQRQLSKLKLVIEQLRSSST